MHPANPYNTRPDFALLAREHPALAAYVTTGEHGASIDFADAAALRALTAALLKADFGLDVALRDDRLCPTLANRLDYVLTALDLVAGLPGPLRVLDIGTGHVAIYLLLLRFLRPEAQGVGSELDDVSREHAAAVLAANGIAESSIRLVPEARGNTLLGWLDDERVPADSWSLTMCNPPFFGSEAEAAEARALKAGAPPAGKTAAHNEEITRGGEEAFIAQMVDESVPLGQRCAWYTSLVGRYASLEPLVAAVRKVTDNYAVLSLRQARTARWVLAWSFGPARADDRLTRPETVVPGTSFARLLPLPNAFVFRPAEAQTVQALRAAVMPVLVGVGLAAGDEDVVQLAPVAQSWSRAARRAAQREAGRAVGGEPAEGGESDQAPQPPAAHDPPEPLFRARLSFDPPSVAEPGAALRIDWTWGRDRTTVDALFKFLVSKSGLAGGAGGASGAGSAKRGADEGDDAAHTEHFAKRGRGRGQGLGRGRGRGGGRARGRGRGWQQ
ncbi:hypothetical protein Q8F55_001252 [Vanrija albida]|uniref:U6 small nuclear RNA (adenine-(43)-N(6))-methyltransferase n=1 Tax=Vanrija albida TaxID=181172 RepID=A0ABR3QGE9_9TREE